jgi:hypothetical protein
MGRWRVTDDGPDVMRRPSTYQPAVLAIASTSRTSRLPTLGPRVGDGGRRKSVWNRFRAAAVGIARLLVRPGPCATQVNRRLQGLEVVCWAVGLGAVVAAPW